MAGPVAPFSPSARGAALCLGLAALPAAAGEPPPWSARTRQLLVVEAPTWDGAEATLRRLERRPGAPWRVVGEPVAVVLGVGLGWGLGLHRPALGTRWGGPAKREGDGRSPAGVFRLTEATGDDARPPPGTTLPYRQAGPRLRCVDDPASPDYNRLVLAPQAGPPPWRSAEAMQRADGLYARTVVVAHNPRRIAGAGSCIFLHVWQLAGQRPLPTVGCTAMPRARLDELLAWLRADAEPLLVQLPAPALRALAADWKLPLPAPAMR